MYDYFKYDHKGMTYVCKLLATPPDNINLQLTIDWLKENILQKVDCKFLF